ncbi:MAG: hypothetical protein LBB17_03205 [Puniceicoccales bacterium]|jgi:hypothetical protein|nr:hypothetical protein [Puniceicoccales bacterium]
MNIINSFVCGVASLFLPEPLGKAVRFFNDNKSRLSDCDSKGKKLLKLIKAECPDQRSLQGTVAGIEKSTIDQALRELSSRSAATVTGDDFIKNTRNALEVHVKKESTKKELGLLMANLNTLLGEFRTVVLRKSTSSQPLSREMTSMVKREINTFFQETRAEVFGGKSKS